MKIKQTVFLDLPPHPGCNRHHQDDIAFLVAFWVVGRSNMIHSYTSWFSRWETVKHISSLSTCCLMPCTDKTHYEMTNIELIVPQVKTSISKHVDMT